MRVPSGPTAQAGEVSPIIRRVTIVPVIAVAEPPAVATGPSAVKPRSRRGVVLQAIVLVLACWCCWRVVVGGGGSGGGVAIFFA